MARISIDNLEPGMVLKEALKNSNGSVLLPAESTLTEKHIRAMKMWGVLDANIALDDNDGTEHAEVSPEMVAQSQDAIKPLFLHCDLDNDAMNEIFNQAAIYHARSS